MSFKKLGSAIVGLVLFGGLLCAVFCTERIPAGYVGVVYSMRGGIEDEVLTQGWHLVAPTKKVQEFTIGNEQIILSKDCREGSEEDDSFAVATSDNANIDISFQMSYRFDEADVVNTYKNFKGYDGEQIVNSRVRTVLKAKISEVTTNYSMMDLYSGNRGEINRELTDRLNKELHDQFGLVVIDASIIDVHPDAQLQQTIDERVKAVQAQQKARAEQETLKVENETKIQQAEAAARQQEITAKAAAEVKRINAQAEADAIRIKAEAEAEGYKLIASSITDDVVELEKAKKWDGATPDVIGSGSTIVDAR